MVRVKGGMTTRRKHKKTLKLARGFWMSRSTQIKKAKEAILHADQYSFLGRKRTKRNMRELWIIRMNAALRLAGMSYSKFIPLLKKNNIALDRKVLAQVAAEYPTVFEKIVEKVR